MNLRDEAELFLDEVRSTLIDALPLASEEDIEEVAEKSSAMSIRQRTTRVSDEDDIDIPPFMR